MVVFAAKQHAHSRSDTPACLHKRTLLHHNICWRASTTRPCRDSRDGHTACPFSTQHSCNCCFLLHPLLVHMQLVCRAPAWCQMHFAHAMALIEQVQHEQQVQHAPAYSYYSSHICCASRVPARASLASHGHTLLSLLYMSCNRQQPATPAAPSHAGLAYTAAQHILRHHMSTCHHACQSAGGPASPGHLATSPSQLPTSPASCGGRSCPPAS
jgi:hypothetical protein